MPQGDGDDGQNEARHSDRHSDPCRPELSAGGRISAEPRDRDRWRGPRVGQRDLRWQRAAERDAARAFATALRLVARAGAFAALQPGIPPVSVAPLVGVWRRGLGRLRLPLHGLAALGAWLAGARGRGSHRRPPAGPPVHPESTPPWLIVRYDHPARGDKPPVKLLWYHGGKQPEPPVLSTELAG